MVEKAGDGETSLSIDSIKCVLTDDLIRLFLVVRAYYHDYQCYSWLTLNRKVSSRLRLESGLASPWHHPLLRLKLGFDPKGGSLSGKKVRPPLDCWSR